MSEFRPISLCNVLYKIFVKVLANRLKKFLNSVINENQSAFAKGRLISDNILIAFKTLHCMKNYNSGATGFMALKLDMSKAYDRVEWVFLENVMRKMGFFLKVDWAYYGVCKNSHLFYTSEWRTKGSDSSLKRSETRRSSLPFSLPPLHRGPSWLNQ